MRVEPYTPALQSEWDSFVRASKNGSFLFLRDYMEYHSDRFVDSSLLIRSDEGKLLALLPANRTASRVSSHAGLTYGGFVTSDAMKLPTMLEVFDASLEHLQADGVTHVIYKSVPFIYHRVPAEEDRYALFLCGATVVRRGVLAVSASGARPPLQERRKRGAKKAKQHGVVVRETDDFASYWTILAERLRQTHGAAPVHTLAEVEQLRSRFPENIKLKAAFESSTMVAGVVVHESERVARAQYIAASDRGQEIGALDLIFIEMLTEDYNAKPYFDFGTSDEQDGRHVNKGLLDQKEGYGARVVAHDHYEIQLDNWTVGQLSAALT